MGIKQNIIFFNEYSQNTLHNIWLIQYLNGKSVSGWEIFCFQSMILIHNTKCWNSQHPKLVEILLSAFSVDTLDEII